MTDAGAGETGGADGRVSGPVGGARATTGASTGLGADRWTLGAGARLHYVTRGDGPLVVLLHGFPDFWYGWRHQIGPLAAAGFRVVAPDLRGYHLSDRPRRVADYRLDTLVADVAALVRGLGAERAHVVGHDWGGVIAWRLAAQAPHVVGRLAILNAPHPGRFRELMLRSSQPLRSWYVLAFLQLPLLPELAFAAGRRFLLRRALRRLHHRPGAITAADLARYADAFAPRGALRGPVDYYRALVRFPPAEPAGRPVPHETLVVWGDEDRASVAENADGLERWVPRVRVRRVPGAGHVVQADAPEVVNAAIAAFFRS